MSSIDTSCLHLLRKYKRKSSMPLPPNTVIYCSYAENLRKTVSRLIGREVNFFTGNLQPEKKNTYKNSILEETPPLPVKQFKKLYITQGALSSSKQFKLVAKDVLDRRYTQQWWNMNRDELKTHFTALDQKVAKHSRSNRASQTNCVVLNSALVSRELIELSNGVVNNLAKRYRQLKCNHRQRVKRSVIQEKAEKVQSELQEKLAALKKEANRVQEQECREIQKKKRTTPRWSKKEVMVSEMDQELKTGVIGKSISKKAAGRESDELSGYSSEEEEQD